MAELYKGQAGSPITYLTSDITANQTTISIADDSALPDAPNICTIGYGENLETIKYETKSNGVLQNVTRGIEGTPQAWPAGTEVARFFTAYDHNAIIDDFVAHKADNTSAHGIDLKANKAVGDWITGTLQNGWLGAVRYRTNDIGLIEVDFNAYGGTIAKDTLVSVLPLGYRPARIAVTNLMSDTNISIPGGLYLSSNGELKLGANVMAGVYYRANLLFMRG